MIGKATLRGGFCRFWRSKIMYTYIPWCNIFIWIET
jgi:hypothetical protein